MGAIHCARLATVALLPGWMDGIATRSHADSTAFVNLTNINFRSDQAPPRKHDRPSDAQQTWQLAFTEDAAAHFVPGAEHTSVLSMKKRRSSPGIPEIEFDFR